MVNQLTLNTLQPLLNKAFILHRDAAKTVEIELVEVAAIKQNKQYSWQKQDISTEREPFTLVFRMPPDFDATQKTYEITHKQFGNLGPIFLVPITQDEDGLYFEAVFT